MAAYANHIPSARALQVPRQGSEHDVQGHPARHGRAGPACRGCRGIAILGELGEPRGFRSRTQRRCDQWKRWRGEERDERKDRRTGRGAMDGASGSERAGDEGRDLLSGHQTTHTEPGPVSGAVASQRRGEVCQT
jgi:hypothetical protein